MAKSLYPKTPDSFPLPGTPENLEVLGLHMHGIWEGLCAEHTATQAENNLAMVMIQKVVHPSGDGRVGVGKMLIGSHQMLDILIRESAAEIVLSRLRIDKKEATPKNFMDYCIRYMGDLTAEMFVEHGRRTGKDADLEVILDESRETSRGNREQEHDLNS